MDDELCQAFVDNYLTEARAATEENFVPGDGEADPFTGVSKEYVAVGGCFVCVKIRGD